MSALFALLAALSNAANVITQHIASTSDPAGSSGWRLVVYLFRNPLWLFGWIALVGAFVFQALALSHGQLSVVQTLMVTELVFGLLIRKVWIHQSIRPVAWASAVLTCVGIGVFVAMAEPQGGNPTPSSHAWASALAVFGGAAAILTLLALRGSPVRRAALFAAAAGTVWALEATFIKSTAATFNQYGLVGMLARWPVYAVAVGGLVGTLLVQAALHVGPLRVSQQLLVIVDPIVSIVLSVRLFEEHFTQDVTALAIAAVAFFAMCAGVVILTQTSPESMRAGGGRGPEQARAGAPPEQ
jgi:hypothetical protein